MLDTLRPLHEMMREGQAGNANDALSSANQQRGPVTMSEMAFLQSYGTELADAYEWCEKYKQTGREAELQQVRLSACHCQNLAVSRCLCPGVDSIYESTDWLLYRSALSRVFH